MDKIRVIVADDEPIYREGLCRILEEEEDIEVVAKSSDYEEAVRLAEELTPGVIVIGVSISEPRSVEVTRRIREVSADTAILGVSHTISGSFLLTYLRAGAAGFLLKKTDLREMVSSIRALCRGEVVLEKNGVTKMLNEIERGELAAKILLLKDREVEVLKVVARGGSNKDVAQELGISGRTVQTHMANIFAKLGVDTRTEAVLYALREGWITLDEVKPPE